jgi:hypothetical protein
MSLFKIMTNITWNHFSHVYDGMQVEQVKGYCENEMR